MADQVDVRTDQVLFQTPESYRPKMKCWAPTNLYSLGVEDSYRRFETIIRTVHLDDFVQAVVESKIIQCPMTQSTHLWNSELMAAWFGMPVYDHNWYGNVSFVVNFNSFLNTFNHFKTYFVEVAEYHTQNASRLLFSSKFHNLREYNPTIPGGPWYMDSNNDHWFPTSARSYKSDFPCPNGHALEFMLELNEDEAKKLYHMSAKQAADHSQANIPGYMKCKKFRSGAIWQNCPFPLSPEQTIGQLNEWNVAIQWA
ncbi:uncharacterized protein LOC119579376 [Penaeus monodon]|uniref:uncharacterized protein LOC119579376 n=1 Tax=Penaeus monodon TaxID=6687 RepID=UPI0018A7012A|nr:uncharacterized protein LOC119579376 [Penaeus monodon]XP_037783078.1 uncharacterized protein LOC119579376 [Penaeus monodon]XP_037783080.1 uncharacterized protein LOC119579376 [Penaeus monodon]XP_037783081.1 uncharacterized protein LOC119579376 [Penaeus monodon]XP_037783082.1 uncharacterized protein LOC119579376 [Penaeus monodon]XP_037783083.1 uncharacterized protein LOC119579376 [Penaeus monodon]